MKRRLVIITEIISPYRIPLFNDLAQHPEVDLHVVFLGESDPSLREWRVYKDEIRFSFQVLRSWRKRIGKYNALLNTGIFSALKKSQPEAILCGGYSYVASWATLFWARRHDVPFLLWSESHQQDQRRQLAMVEFLKRKFLSRCSGFVVPGKSAFHYLKSQSVGDQPIFIAPNAIDNNLFAGASEGARKQASARRQKFGLPQRYYLFVGRLVREKGVFELVQAYAKLDAQMRQQIGLVIVGDGPCRTQLQEVAAGVSPGTLVFPGFLHREELGDYYGLAEAFILPTYTDTWGMVVNEAMACGLPVILSQLAGCAADLVQDQHNGILVPSKDVNSLEAAMKRIASNSDLREGMGRNSKRLILDYSPEKWATSVAEAFKTIVK